jgi:hypothetical protein
MARAKRRIYKKPPAPRYRTLPARYMLGNRVSAVDLEVPCGEEIHHVRIERDSSKKGYSVTMLDHEGFDEEMVAAFVSFGAEPPACWVIAEEWKRDPWWAAAGLTPAASRAPYVACRECNWESPSWHDTEILEWSDLENINAGAPHPVGRCPECGGFAYAAFTQMHPVIRQLKER